MATKFWRWPLDGDEDDEKNDCVRALLLVLEVSFLNVNFTMALLLAPVALAVVVISSRSTIRAGTHPHSDDGERSQTCAPTSILAFLLLLAVVAQQLLPSACVHNALI